MIVYKDTSEFGWDEDNGIGEMLIQQIIAGTKTATCSFKDAYSKDELDQVYSTKGRNVTVVDKYGIPRCNIFIEDIFKTTFGNPDRRLVKGEGDGEDIEKFQEDHRKAWNATMGDQPLMNDTILIVELFRCIEVSE